MKWCIDENDCHERHKCMDDGYITWMNLIRQMQSINEFNMMNQISFMDEHEHLPCDFHMVNYICYAINFKNYFNLIQVFKIHPYDQISVICLIVSW